MYATNAERQRAYRERLRERRQGLPTGCAECARLRARVAELEAQRAIEPTHSDGNQVAWGKALRAVLLADHMGNPAIDTLLRRVQARVAENP